MVNNESNNDNDIIDRYIYQVVKDLPSNSRKDIEEELRTLISDMLEDKCQGSTSTQEDIGAVLKEMGDPYDLSQKYIDKERYLIGPVIFPKYIMVLKIVLLVTAICTGVATIFGFVVSNETKFYNFSDELITDVINALFASFAWITIIFALIEKSGGRKKIKEEWVPSSLPPVPNQELTIPIHKPIIRIIITVMIAVVFIFAPNIIYEDYFVHSTKIISIFRSDVIKEILPLLLIFFTLSIGKNIWEIIEPKISFKYAVFTTVVNVMLISLMCIVFTKYQIWNPDLLMKQNNFFHLKSNVSYDVMNDNLNAGIIAFFAIIYLLKGTIAFYKSAKYRGNR